MDLWLYIPVVVFGVFIFARLALEHKRETAVRALALRRRFTYIGKALPRSLKLAGTALEQTTSVWNVIDGDCEGGRVVVFDCRVGRGKGSYCRTIIATQELSDHSLVLKFWADLAVDHSGSWTILYEPKKHGLRRMPVELLEKLLEQLAMRSNTCKT